MKEKNYYLRTEIDCAVVKETNIIKIIFIIKKQKKKK